MAPEDKEKKRKAATTVAVDAPQPKKTKNSKSAPEEVNKTDILETSMPKAQPAGPTSTITAENKPNSKLKPRKRAVDFLSDSEEKDGGVSRTKPTDAKTVPLGKPKKEKSKKDKVTVQAEEGGPTIDSDAAPKSTVNASNVSRDVSTASNRKRPKIEPKSQEAGTKSEMPATLPSLKKKGPSTVNVHAEQIKKLLGRNDNLPKQDKKTKKITDGQAVGLTANGANGVSSNAVNESLGFAAKDAASKSMQAEPQRTTEKELQDEYGGDDEIDQAGALLEGFDSDTEDLAQDQGFDKGTPTGALPNYKKTQKKLREAAQKGIKDGPGVVYVGRIPHGFYENEMRQYFSQFGTITKLRLSRNRKTGHSKHFAFLEFESNEVAKIVAETMDTYLMFGHILKCKYVQPEALHPDTFKGANKRFRVAPHNRMEKRALEAPKSESQWMKKNSKEQFRRETKAEKLKAMGYEIELPKLKSPSEVLQQKESQTAKEEMVPNPLAGDDEEVPAPTAVPKDEFALSKKESEKENKVEKEKTVVAGANDVSAATLDVNAPTSEPVPSQNGTAHQSGKPDKRKEKRQNANRNDEEKQLDAQLVTDQSPSIRKARPEITGTEATTATSDSAKASRSSKQKKKGQGSNVETAADKTPAPATTNLEIVPVEKDAPIATAPAEDFEDGKRRKKSKKRKSFSAGGELAGSKPKSTEPAAGAPEGRKVHDGAETKSILKKAKKA